MPSTTTHAVSSSQSLRIMCPTSLSYHPDCLPSIILLSAGGAAGFGENSIRYAVLGIAVTREGLECRRLPGVVLLVPFTTIPPAPARRPAAAGRRCAPGERCRRN